MGEGESGSRVKPPSLFETNPETWRRYISGQNGGSHGSALGGIAAAGVDREEAEAIVRDLRDVWRVDAHERLRNESRPARWQSEMQLPAGNDGMLPIDIVCSKCRCQLNVTPITPLAIPDGILRGSYLTLREFGPMMGPIESHVRTCGGMFEAQSPTEKKR